MGGCELGTGHDSWGKDRRKKKQPRSRPCNARPVLLELYSANESSEKLVKLHFNSVGLGRGPGFCISNKLWGEAKAAGLVHTMYSEDPRFCPEARAERAREGR